MTDATGPSGLHGNARTYAVSFSGGKDSVLALDRAARRGLAVAGLFTIYDEASRRLRFHGVRRELIESQAESLGIPLVIRATGRVDGGDYEKIFLECLEELRSRGIAGVVFGNIHLRNVRRWCESRTTRFGFEHVEPLWGEDPLALAHESVTRGYRARIVSLMTDRVPVAWLGSYLDEVLPEMEQMDIDPCGENGEYHTFVESGPMFKRALDCTPGIRVETESHALLDLKLASFAGEVPSRP